MAEGGLPGPAPHREEQPPPPIPQPQPGQQAQMHMNWSHFKPEYPVNQKKMLKLIC